MDRKIKYFGSRPAAWKAADWLQGKGYHTNVDHVSNVDTGQKIKARFAWRLTAWKPEDPTTQ